jgi:nitrite reductase/ring-hydroxylating ferredoxin subunit/uncharacterized membrane protein
MKSKANFKSHPIHPMLIPFPIAFLFGAFLFHVISVITLKEIFWEMGNYLSIAGIISAIAAAIPGTMDYLYTVPPNSSGKKRATKHALVNFSSVILFTFALLFSVNKTSAWSVLGIEVIGLGLLIVGGWLGGTLAFRNQIGVDHRYAGAGKWNEEYLQSKPGERVKIAKADELKVNQMKLIHLNNKRIVIGRTEENYVAFDDHCTHRGGSLAGGTMMCGLVHCPWHGSQFDVSTGVVKAGPALKEINIYRLQEENGVIYLVDPLNGNF